MGKNKRTLNVPLSMVKLFVTLWIVYQYTGTKIQASFLTQLPERKETSQGFHHEANGDFKQLEFNGSCFQQGTKVMLQKILANFLFGQIQYNTLLSATLHIFKHSGGCIML